jgi:hypothetical protein
LRAVVSAVAYMRLLGDALLTIIFFREQQPRQQYPTH